MNSLNKNSFLKANAKVMILSKVIENRESKYKPIGIFYAYWQENKGLSSKSNSRNRNDIDKVTCFVFDILRFVDSEDILIRNDDGRQILPCKSLKEYQEKYKAHVVTTADVYDLGSPNMWHTRIGAI